MPKTTWPIKWRFNYPEELSYEETEEEDTYVLDETDVFPSYSRTKKPKDGYYEMVINCDIDNPPEKFVCKGLETHRGVKSINVILQDTSSYRRNYLFYVTFDGNNSYTVHEGRNYH